MSPHSAGALPIPIQLDARAPEPLNQQVYQAVRALILEGRLAAGMRLPSTRQWAIDLTVSRNTVLNAFERLAAEGYVEGRRGGGTRVAAMLPDELLRAHAAAGTPAPARLHRRPSALATRTAACPVPLRHGYIGGPARAFRLGGGGLAEFPIARWGDLARRRWESASPGALDYGVVAGYAPLRTAIARYLTVSRSVRCEPDQVLIVNGTQQALDLITRVLLNPGEQAWLEDPGYDGARGALVAGGARVVPVPVDREGLDVAAGMRRAPRARLAYVTPAHQFPLGSTMSLPRRLDLLRWAHKARAWLIEDDYDSEFRYVNRPLASLQGLDTAGCVIYTGTFSKALFPALRLGYLVVPPALIETCLKVRFFLDVHAPTFMQTVLADFITEGHFERHLLRARMRCRERQEALREGLRRELGGLLEVEPSDGGMHMLAWLPPHIHDREASRRAAAEGIDTVPLSAFAQARLARGALVLGYAGLTPEDIANGTKRLAKALHSLRRHGHSYGRSRRGGTRSTVIPAAAPRSD